MAQYNDRDMSSVDDFAKWLYLWTKVDMEEKGGYDAILPHEIKDNDTFLLDVTQKAMDYMSSGAGTLEELQEQLDIISERVLKKTMEIEAEAKASGRTSLDQLFADYAPKANVPIWSHSETKLTVEVTQSDNSLSDVKMDVEQQEDKHISNVNVEQLMEETKVLDILSATNSTLDEFTVNSQKEYELSEEDTKALRQLNDSKSKMVQERIEHMDITDKNQVPEKQAIIIPSAKISTFGKIRLFFKKMKTTPQRYTDKKADGKIDKRRKSVPRKLIALLSCGGGPSD